MKLLTLLKSQPTNRWFALTLAVAMFSGLCFISKEPLKVSFDSPLPKPKYGLAFKELPNSFYDLEYKAAKSFLNQKLFYPSLMSFQKARLSAQTVDERSMAAYGLIFTNYLAKKFETLQSLYASGLFEELDKNAPYFEDAILMFYVAFEKSQAPFIFQNLKSYLYQNPALKTRLELYHAICQANFANNAFNEHFNVFKAHEKSQILSAMMNLAVPGSGYLYLGQVHTALTCFLLLGFLLWGMHHAFKTRHFAQGVLIFSIFSGFYLGSIVGVQQAAEHYNKTLYTAIFDPLLQENQLYPDQNINYAP